MKAEGKDDGTRMGCCAVCVEKEQLLKGAVLEHLGAKRQYQTAFECSEDLSAVEENMQATRHTMNQAEDSYRQHLRLTHGSAQGTHTFHEAIGLASG